MFDKNNVKISIKTFEDINDVIHESKKVLDMQPNLEKAFKQMNTYNKSLENFEKENANLKQKNDKLREHNKSLINTINDLLETLAKLFRRILHIGNEKDKDNTVDSIKKIYDKGMYSKWEVDDIGKGTSREIPLRKHVGLLPKGYDKYLKKLNREAAEDIEEFQERLKNKGDDLCL